GRRSHAAWLDVVIRALLEICAFAWPGFLNKQVLTETHLQNGVTKILNQTYHADASNVSCPANEAVTVGNSFTCTATVGGQTKHVQVTVKTTDGVYEVAEPN